MTSASEILRLRLAARGSLIEFARQVGYPAAAHHRLLAEKLEAVERGQIRKLCFNLPPGVGKTIWGNLFSLWYMSRAPRAVLGISNVTELAERLSRRIRNWAQQHGQTLGVTLDDSTQSAGHWALSNSSTYSCAGVGSSVLGLRCDLLYTDDPLRSRDESLSPTARENLWEFYHSSARTRLKPSGSEILVMTRFSEDDLAARLIESESDWDVVNVSAEAQPGDILGRSPGTMLWLEGDYGYGQRLSEIKKTTLPEIWSSMYQGQPVSLEGNFFKTDFFRSMTVMPARDQLHIYGASDYAVSAGKNDFTVHLVVGLDGDGTLYILDCWRRQAATDVSVEAFCDLVLQYRPIGWACEKGQLASAIEPYMKIRQRARNASVAMEMFSTRGDKSVRCQAIRARLALSPAVVPTHADWWPDVRAELLSFPGAGKHDDAADALGLCGQILDRMSSPHVPTPKEPRKTIVIGGPSSATLLDVFEENEKYRKRHGGAERIK